MSLRPAKIALLAACLLQACSSSSGSGAEFEASPSTLRFGTVVAGSGESMTFQVKSKTDEALHLEVTGLGAGIAVEPMALDLPAREARHLTVKITATEPGTLLSRFQVKGGATSVRIEAAGAIVASAVSAQTQVSIGDVPVGTSRSARVPLTNLLSENVAVQASIRGDGPEAFRLEGEAALDLEPKGVAEVGVTFAPTCVGERQAELVLTTCDGCAETIVKLQGNATGARLAVMPDLLAFDVTPPGGQRVKQLTVENQGCTPLSLTRADAGDQPFAATAQLPLALETLSPVTLDVAFKPAARASYAGDLTVQAGDLSDTVRVRGDGGGPEIEVDPPDLQVGVRTAGGEVAATRKVTLRHAGSTGKLRITAVEVTEGPFTAEVSRMLPADLAPGPLEITVTLDSTTVGSYEGKLHVVAEDPGQPDIVVPLHGRVVDGPTCEIAMYPTSLRFGVVAEGDARTREVHVRNIGLETCQAWDFRIDGGSFFAVVDPPLVADIPQHGEQVVHLRYAPTDSTGALESAKLTFQLMGAPARTEVPVSALATPSDIRAEPPQLDLGTGPVGLYRIGVVSLVNRSGGRLAVNGAALENVPSLGVMYSDYLRSLIPGQRLTAFVRTYPLFEGTVDGELEFRLPAYSEPLIVPVTATAVAGPCGEACDLPIASCPADRDLLVNEDTTVRGIAIQGDGHDAACAWAIASAPAGSTASLGGEGCSVGLRPDLPGDYELQLTASTAGGNRTCKTTVHAASYAGLRVVLRWSRDSDVDLHLVHASASDFPAGGSWFKEAYNCWSENPHPLWDSGSRDDDPLLVRDDQSGSGPEEIRLPAPASGHAYHVLAHWYGPALAGGTDVTAEIYCGDRLADTRTATLPAIGFAAWLADVSWDGASCTVQPQEDVFKLVVSP